MNCIYLWTRVAMNYAVYLDLGPLVCFDPDLIHLHLWLI